MGVRGLTTYIERNKEKYLRNHRLRDTHLVIDGNSLCAQLYKYQSKCNDVFGGDYDKFARCIEHFFTTLKQCNVTAIVILDGGYETRKLKTVHSRLKNKLKIIRNYGPLCADAATVFPLFLREAFKDTLLKLKICTVRCEYEADLDIACVARRLRCPVLSYDSDFYIFDVQYIPFPTLDHHVTKLNDTNGSKYCVCCKIYEVHRFLRNCGLDKTHLPLMATMLGNDYIKKGVFKKFYNQIKLPKRNGCRSGQYRTIIAVIEWLKEETFESAVRKILGRLKRKQRYRVARKIEQVTEGYVCEFSELFEYLGLEQMVSTNEVKLQINADEIQSDTESSAGEDVVLSSESDNEPGSDESEHNGDTMSECSDESVDHINSPWFKKNFRTGNFPTLYIDVLTLNMCVYTPQVEDTTNLYTLEISLPVLRAICKILLPETSVNFVYLARNDRSRLKKYVLQVSELDLPRLGDLDGLSGDTARETVYQVLELTSEDVEKIEHLPERWRLYFMSLIYWTRKSILPKVTYAHICTIVLCLININIIDLKFPSVRSKTSFLKKYETQLKTSSQQTVETDKNQPDNATVGDLIQTVDTNDCLFFIDALVANFTMDEKLTANKRLYSLHIVDAFAQFQSCLLFVKYLNTLLNAPVESFDICQFYNGTFIYNLYANFEKRSDIHSYIELLLKRAPHVLRLFNEIMNVIGSIVDVEHVAINKKRRRRRKKDKNTTDDRDSDNVSDKGANSDTFNDVNNKFSILSVEN